MARPCPDGAAARGLGEKGIQQLTRTADIRIYVVAILLVLVPIVTAIVLRVQSRMPLEASALVGFALSLVFLVTGRIVLSSWIGRARTDESTPRTVGDTKRRLARIEIGLSLELLAIVTFAAAFDLRVGLACLCLLIAWPLLWLPERLRRIEIKSAVDVRCSPEAAFAFISDPNNWPRYILTLQLLQPVGPLTVGSTFGLRIQRHGRQPFEGRERVIAFEPGSRFGTAIVEDPRSTGIVEVIPIDGGTRIEYTFRSVRDLPSAFAGAFFKRRTLLERLRTNRAAINARLKAVLEEGSPSAV